MQSEQHFPFTEHPLEGWTYKKLIDCTSDRTLSYGIVQPGIHVEGGIPIIRVNNVNNGQLRLDDVMQVTPEIESKYKRTRLEGGEVLLTLVGSTGQSVVVPKELAGWNIARAIAVIRPKPEIGANWINICLQTREVQQFHDERANTTVQKTLNLGDVRELPIPIPPIEAKKQIENIAMALTNKIAINRQINQTLEQMVQAIFNFWFVDFEPVRIRSGDRPGLTPEIMALFPDELVDSELGKIPRGWEVSAIGDEVTVCGGGTPSTANPDFWDGDFAWITPKDLSKQPDKVLIDSARTISAAGVNKISSGQLPIGTVLLSSRAPIGYLTLTMIPVSINQGFIAMICNKRLPNAYVLQWTTASLDAIKQRGSGTTFAEISKTNFRQMRVLVPCEKVLTAFQEAVEPLYAEITSKVRESRTLATLRDTLLPKLLSGELAVTFAEEAA
ncbi:MAG: restriction endonuclease subunit S [Proteobacteria bacterium]|nr:restriction endonuclease subunit S [Pseudomonadota bacterium]